MKIYQVDAFAATLFQGNPAAVVPLPAWLPDALMQNIAMENNLAETAFIVPQQKPGAARPDSGGDAYDYLIRWFTPTVEVELCGHATLAAGHVVFRHLEFKGEVVVFRSLHSGELRVSKEEEGAAAVSPATDGTDRSIDGKLVLDFPANPPSLVEPSGQEVIFEGLGIQNRALYKGRHDYMIVMDDQGQVEALNPDFKILAGSGGRGVVVTAPGKKSDFVSRCFYPQSGIDEDPVTGSAHTMMTPYWAGRLGKDRLSAIQLSRRKGFLDCRLAGDRVFMGGYARTFLQGEIFL